jgi:cytochrome c oxidase assembly protein subunit 15
MILYFANRILKERISRVLRIGVYMLITLLITQVVLGILTVVNSVGYVPTNLGVLHQAGALFLLTAMLFVDYQIGSGSASRT